MANGAEKHELRCMEVWGGNQALDSGVIMTGLDAWAYSRPSGGDASGGDVYYMSSCASGRINRALIADVSGHGAGVAELSGRLRQLMRRYINHIDQRTLAASLNDEFANLSQEGRFATALLVTFFAPNRHLAISNAGHPPPARYDAATRSWSLIQARSEADASDGAADLPLGVVEAGSYGQVEMRLRVGDLLLCYTDALTEARRADGRLLGGAGLIDLLQGIDVADPSAIIPALLRKLEELDPGNLDRDDLTIMLLRPNGLARQATLGERLRGAGRMGRALLDAMRKNGQAMPWPDSRLANWGGALISPLSRLWRGDRASRT